MKDQNIKQYFIDKKIGNYKNNKYIFTKQELLELRIPEKIIINNYKKIYNTKNYNNIEWTIQDIRRLIEFEKDPNLYNLQEVFDIKIIPNKEHEYRILKVIFNEVYDILKSKEINCPGMYQYRIKFPVGTSDIVPDGTYLYNGNVIITIEVQEAHHKTPELQSKDRTKKLKLEALSNNNAIFVPYDISDKDLKNIIKEISCEIEHIYMSTVSLSSVKKHLGHMEEYQEIILNEFGQIMIDNHDSNTFDEKKNFPYKYNKFKLKCRIDNKFDDKFIKPGLCSTNDSSDDSSSDDEDWGDDEEIESIDKNKLAKGLFEEVEEKFILNEDYIIINNEIYINHDTMMILLLQSSSKLGAKIRKWFLKLINLIRHLYKVAKKSQERFFNFRISEIKAQRAVNYMVSTHNLEIAKLKDTCEDQELKIYQLLIENDKLKNTIVKLSNT